jgi:hypothetical protein
MMNVVAWLRHATMSAIGALNGPPPSEKLGVDTDAHPSLWILHAR